MYKWRQGQKNWLLLRKYDVNSLKLSLDIKSVFQVKTRNGQETFFLFWKCLKILNQYFRLLTKHLDYLQVSRWPSAGFSQKRSTPRHLLPSVALARPAVPPWAASGGAVRVRLPHEEGWSVCQPIPLPESRDARYESSACAYLFFRCYHSFNVCFFNFKVDLFYALFF